MAKKPFTSLIDAMNSGARRPVIDDFASALRTLPAAFATGKAKGFDRIGTLRRLRSLSLREISQDQLDLVAKMDWLEDLRVFGFRGVDATALMSLKKLRTLSFQWAPKLRDVTVFGRLKHLDVMAIGDFKAIDDFKPLGALTRLRALSVTGPNLGRQACRSLEPFGRMQGLEELWLAGVQAPGDDLRALARLTGLRRLQLANWYPAREFARLAVALADTQCDLFKPTSSLAGKFEVYNPKTGEFEADKSVGTIMLTGKPAKLLKSGDPATAALVAKRTAEFNAWQSYYRDGADPAKDARTTLPGLTTPGKARR